MNKTSTLFFALLAACGSGDINLDREAQVAPLAQAASPAGADFTLVTTRFAAGRNVNFQVSQGKPNSMVKLSYGSHGLGAGPCPQVLHGECFGFVGPAQELMAEFETNHNGFANFDLTLPQGLEGEYLSVQAVIIDDDNKTAYLSNPISSMVAPMASAGGNASDNDMDGYSRMEGDCDDLNANFSPAAPDPVGDGFDTNCDTIDGEDGDFDGSASIASGGDDCDDTNEAISPLNAEICDGIDNSCDGAADMANGLPVCDIIEEFSTMAPVRPDVLFVVENTGSSAEAQGRLSAAASNFFNQLDANDIDAHVGVIASNAISPAFSGRLQESQGYRFVDLEDAGVSNATKWFEMVVGGLGTQGNNPGAGRRAVGQALNPPLIDTYNMGFLRAASDIHVVFVSDQDDSSAGVPSTSVFTDTLMNAKAPYAGKAHAIVGPPGGCSFATAGTEYLMVATDSGGTVGSVCKTEYDGFFDGFVADLAANTEPRTVFSFDPAIDSYSLSLYRVQPDGTRTQLDPADFEWDHPNRAAVLLDPASSGFGPDDVIQATYNLQ